MTNIFVRTVVKKPVSSVLYSVVGAFTDCALRLFTFSMLRSTQRTVKLLENSYHTKQHTMWQLLLTTRRRWSKLRTLMLPQGLDFNHFIIILCISYSVITIYVMKLERNKYNLFQRQDISFFVQLSCNIQCCWLYLAPLPVYQRITDNFLLLLSPNYTVLYDDNSIDFIYSTLGGQLHWFHIQHIWKTTPLILYTVH